MWFSIYPGYSKWQGSSEAVLINLKIQYLQFEIKNKHVRVAERVAL